MSTESTAIRLAGKLALLTAAGKISWLDAGHLGPWGEWPGQVFKASVDDGTFAQIAEVPIPKSMITSYYFGVAEGKPEIFEVNIQDRPEEIFGVFAEGYPADPSNEKLRLLNSLKDLYQAARDSAKGTREKMEKFEQTLERRLA
jgi:hypothetical protein